MGGVCWKVLGSVNWKDGLLEVKALGGVCCRVLRSAVSKRKLEKKSRIIDPTA